MLLGCALLHVSRNMKISDNTLIRDGLRALRQRLPPGWSAREAAFTSRRSVDTTIKIAAPARRTGLLTVEARARLDPKGVRPIIESIASGARRSTPLVIARYLSEATRT